VALEDVMILGRQTRAGDYLQEGPYILAKAGWTTCTPPEIAIGI